MPHHLCLTITFLDPRFHGRRDGGEPEWPPSPLRLYQAIVAAAAAPTGRIEGSFADSLRWFERLPAPRIVTPAHRTGEPYRLSVPNNAMDLVVKAWARGNYDGSGDANPATHRTMKTVRPTHLVGGDQVRYIWALPEPLSQEDRRQADSIRIAVRSIVALGWGIDLVVGHGELTSIGAAGEPIDPSNEQWAPGSQRDGTPLRTPKPGTFDSLLCRHRAFLNRVTDDGFVPVPPLTTFSVVGYRRASEPKPRPFAAFTLRPIAGDGSDKKVSFPQHRSVCVAAMLRHAALEAAKSDLDSRPDGWRTPDWAEQFVAGHGPRKPDGRLPDESWPRFSYLPLPSLTPIGVGDIRRVLIAEPVGGAGQAATWATRRLAGADLIDQRTQNRVAILEPLSNADFVLSQYTAKSAARREWSSVSPVILPGYDDGKPAKRERLLVECLRHAGYDAAAIESIESRPTSWFPRVASSLQFKRPAYLRNLPAVHVRLRFHEPIPGPLALGAGRHCGLGVFAALDT